MAFLNAAAPTRDLIPARWTAATWRSLLMLGAGATAFAVAPSRPVQVGLLLAGVALLGAPHGVFDMPLLWDASRRRVGVLARLTGLYVAISAAVLAGWALAPLATLLLFLALAAVHFGLEQSPGPAASTVDRLIHPAARGVSVLVPLLFLHPMEVIPWVSALAGQPASQVQAVVAAMAPAALGLWILLVAVSATRRLQDAEPAAALELVALVGLFLLAPPLLAFAVYFTAIHSAGHVLEVARGRARPGPRTWSWLAAWLAPAALVCTLGLLAIARAGGLEGAAVQALRILAALAAPHLLLGPWLERRAGAARSWPASCAHPAFKPPLPSAR